MTSADAVPHGKQHGKAAASGWIGSALEYYDFFIYAQAAALVFPAVFFDRNDPRMGIIGALGTYAVGYVARPIGAFYLGAWGDKHGRKNVLVLCMLLMGFSTFLVALLPTYQQIGFLAPAMLLALRLVQGFAVAGEISGASTMILEHSPFGRRAFFGSFTLQGTQAGQIFAAAVFIPLATYMSKEAFESWGWRIPFLLSVVVVVAGYIIRRRVAETPAFEKEEEKGTVPVAPIATVFRESPGTLLRVFCMALTNIVPVTTSVFAATYAVQASYGIGFSASVYLWIPVLGNIVAVICIPFVGNLADKVGRRPTIITGAAVSGFMSFGYLWAISQKNVPLAIIFSLVMWGAVYQGYNAVFPAFYPEQFPTRTRVTGMAIAQNLGTAVSSFMAVIFTVIVPPGSTNVWQVVGSLTFGITLIAAFAAYKSPETYRFRSEDLGVPGAQPVSVQEYTRLRQESIDTAKRDRAAKRERAASS